MWAFSNMFIDVLRMSTLIISSWEHTEIIFSQILKIPFVKVIFLHNRFFEDGDGDGDSNGNGDGDGDGDVDGDGDGDGW